MLKPTPDCKVERHYKFTVTDATEQIPKINDPDRITDIVFQVGLNDTRKGISSEKVCNDTLEMQLAYKKHLKNARQHIAALPPLDDPQIETNTKLQRLANQTNSNFVSTKEFRDRSTGRLRMNTMHDYHYNNIGIKILSKEIKKSLFAESNLNDDTLTQLANMRSRMSVNSV